MNATTLTQKQLQTDTASKVKKNQEHMEWSGGTLHSGYRT